MKTLSAAPDRLVFVVPAEPALDYTRGEEIPLGTLLTRYDDTTTASYAPIAPADRPQQDALSDTAVKYLGPDVVAFGLNLWHDGHHVATVVTTDHDLLDLPAHRSLRDVLTLAAPTVNRVPLAEAPKVVVFLDGEQAEVTLELALEDYGDCVVRMYRPAPKPAVPGVPPRLDELSAQAAGEAYRAPLPLVEQYSGRHALHLELLRYGKPVETLIVLDRDVNGFETGQGVHLADWFSPVARHPEPTDGEIRVVTVQPQQQEAPYNPQFPTPHPYHVRPDGKIHLTGRAPYRDWPVGFAGCVDRPDDFVVSVVFPELFGNPAAALGRYPVVEFPVPEGQDGRMGTVDHPIERVHVFTIPTPADFDQDDDNAVGDWRG